MHDESPDLPTNSASPVRHRRMLVLAGERAWGTQAAVALARGFAPCWWITDAPPPDAQSHIAAKAQMRLGSECDALVFDVHGGFDVDAFGACAGLVRAGGLFLLLAPPLHEWAHRHDPEHGRIADHPHTSRDVTGRFLARFVRLLGDENIPVVGPDDPLPDSTFAPPRPAASPFATEEQRLAVEAIERVGQGHPHRPLVLLAHRGRGKSAALGLAAKRLAQAGRRVVITAPRFTAAEIALRHADNDRRISFAPPDALAAGDIAADVVLVDEAAAIPTPLLTRLLARHARLVFASTVHGYEGTGRGLLLRFARELDARTPGWNLQWLHTPVRWDAGDPLERLAFRALLLDAEPADEQRLHALTAADCVFEPLDRDALATDENTLAALFGLLVLAHYRTGPMDLRQLLDGPNVHVFAARYRGHVVGTALAVAEGGFDAQLAHAVWAGRRRVRGHLLAQSLAQHAGIQQAPCRRGWRILRIAVHPAVQGRGIGTRLLQTVVEHARQGACDYVGVSFGAEPGLVHFWRRTDFRPVRLGLARDASSGMPSVMMLHPLTPAGMALLSEARARLLDALPHLLADPLRDLAPEIAALMLAHYDDDPQAIIDGAHDWRELVAFACGARDYAQTLAPLWRLAKNYSADPDLPAPMRDALVLKVLERRTWPQTAQILGLSGRGAVKERLQVAVKLLAERHGGEAARLAML